MTFTQTFLATFSLILMLEIFQTNGSNKEGKLSNLKLNVVSFKIVLKSPCKLYTEMCKYFNDRMHYRKIFLLCVYYEISEQSVV